jgi:hypothetical protein
MPAIKALLVSSIFVRACIEPLGKGDCSPGEFDRDMGM